MNSLSMDWVYSSHLYCRSCLKRSTNLKSIFGFVECVAGQSKHADSSDKKLMQIIDVLRICVPEISIESTDQRSKSVCVACLEKLCEFHVFRMGVLHTNTEWHRIDELRQSKPSDVESSLRSKTTASLKYAMKPMNESSSQPPNQKVKSAPRNKSHCDICNKYFVGGYRFEQHLIRKHFVRNDVNVFKPFECDACDKAYTTLANLNIHKLIHSGVKAFKCCFCDRAFYREMALNNHMTIHTGLKRFECQKCNRTFTSSNILKQHMKTHASNRPHKCKFCPREFFIASDLRVHTRTHTDERNYMCSLCGRRFPRKTHLNGHLRTHTGERPYECKWCPKTFALSGDLTAHARIHTGDRPYNCKLCDKNFNQSSGLRAHMKSHTGERSYICILCDRGFTQPSSLARHMKLHKNYVVPA